MLLTRSQLTAGVGCGVPNPILPLAWAAVRRVRGAWLHGLRVRGRRTQALPYLSCVQPCALHERQAILPCRAPAVHLQGCERAAVRHYARYVQLQVAHWIGVRSLGRAVSDTRQASTTRTPALNALRVIKPSPQHSSCALVRALDSPILPHQPRHCRPSDPALNHFPSSAPPSACYTILTTCSHTFSPSFVASEQPRTLEAFLLVISTLMCSSSRSRSSRSRHPAADSATQDALWRGAALSSRLHVFDLAIRFVSFCSCQCISAATPWLSTSRSWTRVEDEMKI